MSASSSGSSNDDNIIDNNICYNNNDNNTEFLLTHNIEASEERQGHKISPDTAAFCGDVEPTDVHVVRSVALPVSPVFPTASPPSPAADVPVPPIVVQSEKSVKRLAKIPSVQQKHRGKQQQQQDGDDEYYSAESSYDDNGDEDGAVAAVLEETKGCESGHSLEDGSGSSGIGKVKANPIPKGALLAASIVFVCEGFAYSFLFPFVGFMILDFGLVKEERETGYYAGMLAGSFSLFQFFSSFVFGVMADRVSKRSVVLFSTFGSLVTMLLFGLSPNFAFALALRGANGALNGNSATAKAYLSDITDATNQDVAFSFVGLAWGIGAICGPAIGGFLARPATQYPSVFGGVQLFHKFPYLLPCLFQAAVMSVGFICTAIFMKPASQLGLGGASETDTEAGDDSYVVHDETGEEIGDVEMTEINIVDVDFEMQQDMEPGMARSSSEQHLLQTHASMADDDDSVLLKYHHSDIPEQHKEESMKIKRSFFLRVGLLTKNVLRACVTEAKELSQLTMVKEVALAILLYGLVSAIDTFHEELMPLWAMIPRDQGGLSFTTTSIGAVQMVMGLLLLSQPLFFPICARILGKANSFVIGMMFVVPLAATPQISLLTRASEFLLYVGLAVYCLFRFVFSMLTFTAVFIFINNSAPPGTAGRVMSFSNSIGCVSRTIAPFVAGPLFAFFANILSGIPLIALNPAFIVVSLLGIISALITFMLPKSIEEPKKAHDITFDNK